MKIRSVLRLASLIPLALALMVVAVYLVAADQLRAAKARADLADQVTVGAFELNMLTYDYVAAPSKRPKQQWEARHRSIGALLDQAEVDDPVQTEMLERIRRNHQGIAKVFVRLVEASEPGQAKTPASGLAEEWKKRLVGQILQRSHDMVSNAQTLGNNSRAELIRIQRVSDQLVLAMIVVSSAVFLGTLLGVARKIGKPLDRLYRGVQVVGSGNLDVEIPVQSDDEIGNISQAFNQSARSLKESRTALEEEVAERKRAENKVRHLNDVLRAIRIVNQLIAREHDRGRLLQGICDSLVEVRGSHHSWIVLLDHEYKMAAAAEAGLGETFSLLVEQMQQGRLCDCVRRALSQSEVVLVDENSPSCTDCALAEVYRCGRTMAVRLECSNKIFGVMAMTISGPFASRKEDQRLFQEVAGDVALALHSLQLEADHKRAEEERERLIATLENQKAELERFAYTVSHDLKSPLITIKGYVGLLSEDLAGAGGKSIEDDLARISNAADKMDVLLKDLLEMSRIGRLVNPPEDVPLEELAREAIELVAGQAKQNAVQIEVSPDLPVVFGDRLRLLEVMQNLIDNAIKYMGDQSQPRVEIGSRRDGNEAICYVRDNGIGIEPRYHKGIFELFHQLNQTLEGSGIGLTLVKRIVEVHGGRVWVESEGAGHGSTFCFTIAAGSESAEHQGVEPRTAGH